MKLPKPYYEKNGIIIYCGDCRKVLPTLGKCDLLLTDPPYGILSESGSAATRRSGGNLNDGKIVWDVSLDDEAIALICSKADNVMIWGGCHLRLPPTFGYLIWDKKIDGLNFGEVEFCWTNLRFAPRIFHWRAVGVDGGKVHPTQKPLALMKWCIDFAADARMLLDPFMGSGTTLCAAKDLGCRAIGIEIEEKYCEIAVRRLELGKQAFKHKSFAPLF